MAAFFGAFMNMSFLLAGSASVNPVMFTLAIGLILAWKVAGYYGLDRYLLPMLGHAMASERRGPAQRFDFLTQRPQVWGRRHPGRGGAVLLCTGDVSRGGRPRRAAGGSRSPGRSAGR